MEPTGEDAKRLHELLTRLVENSVSGSQALERLQRVVVFYAPKITNESIFLATLCAQEKDAVGEISMRLVRFYITLIMNYLYFQTWFQL